MPLARHAITPSHLQCMPRTMMHQRCQRCTIKPQKSYALCVPEMKFTPQAPRRAAPPHKNMTYRVMPHHAISEALINPVISSSAHASIVSWIMIERTMIACVLDHAADEEATIQRPHVSSTSPAKRKLWYIHCRTYPHMFSTCRFIKYNVTYSTLRHSARKIA